MQRTTFSRFAVVFALSALAVAGPLAGHAVASHGDYFHVTWQQRAARTVDFTVASAFHRSSYDADDCVPGPCRGPNGVPAVGDVVTEDVAGTVL